MKQYKETAITKELKRLATKCRGLLTPECVVHAAALPQSPLHNAFTWDDSEAAEQYRLWQARQLIRTTVQYVNIQGQPRAMRVFVSLTPDRECDAGGYRQTLRVLTHSEQRRQMLQDALAEMECFQAKYTLLTELAEVFAAMRKARSSLK